MIYLWTKPAPRCVSLPDSWMDGDNKKIKQSKRVLIFAVVLRNPSWVTRFTRAIFQQVSVSHKHLHGDAESKPSRRRGQSRDHPHPPPVLRQPVLRLIRSLTRTPRSALRLKVVVKVSRVKVLTSWLRGSARSWCQYLWLPVILFKPFTF